MPLRLIFTFLALAALTACGDPASTSVTDDGSSALTLPSGTVVDLSHAFNEDAVYWPTAEGFSREVTEDGMTEGGYYYASGTFTSAEHGGTHIDAPIHFFEGAHTVDEIPLDRLMGPAVVIDVSDHAEANPDYQISVEDLEEWEIDNGPLPDGSIILFRTGFGAYWPDRERYMGTDERGAQAVAELHFPGLSSDAAQWLIANRTVDVVGIDTPSIDYGQSQGFRTHRVLFEKNIPAIENLANLDQVPEVGSVVVALPMKIEGGSGGPVRVIAFIP